MTNVRGELYAAQARRHFTIARVPLEGPLDKFIEHVWIIRWALPAGKAYTSEVLPYPAANLVFADGAARISGVGTKKFSYVLRGSGVIVGVLFRPAGFYAFYSRSQAHLKDVSLPLGEVFVSYPSGFAAELLACDDDEIIRRVQLLLAVQEPAENPAARTAGEIVERIAQNRAVTKVADVSAIENMSVRRLEQLFREYVGVAPKWVIKRARLHEAAGRLGGGSTVNLAALSHELGYSDQAHFTRDFKRIIGCPPAEYARRAGIMTT